MIYSSTHMATVGVKGLSYISRVLLQLRSFCLYALLSVTLKYLSIRRVSLSLSLLQYARAIETWLIKPIFSQLSKICGPMADENTWSSMRFADYARCANLLGPFEWSSRQSCAVFDEISITYIRLVWSSSATDISKFWELSRSYEYGGDIEGNEM